MIVLQTSNNACYGLNIKYYLEFELVPHTHTETECKHQKNQIRRKPRLTIKRKENTTSIAASDVSNES